MIIKYPRLKNNSWLKEGSYIGNKQYPYDVFTITSVVYDNGIRIKYKPYKGNMSLDDIYYIPNSFVVTENDGSLVQSNDFENYYNNNKDELSLKYTCGTGECNICKKVVDNIIDYIGNGSFYCEDCLKSKKELKFDCIYEFVSKDKINFSQEVMKLLNLFDTICIEKMADISKVEKFFGKVVNLILHSNNNIYLEEIKDIFYAKPESDNSICKIKDSIFCNLSLMLVKLHDGSKRNIYIKEIYDKSNNILIDFLSLYNKTVK